MARGHFDRAGGGYVETDQERRRRETRERGWDHFHPYVEAEYGCEWCSTGTMWDSRDFYIERGSIPLSVEQARAFEEVCCEGDKARLDSFTVWAPDSSGPGLDDPLLDWRRDA